jgi:RNA polymerase sigma-54 factor
LSQVLAQLPRQLLAQQQRLTPQLIQAMDILQLNMLALESRISQELDGNPALELAGGDDDVIPVGEAEPVEPVSDREQPLVVDESGESDFGRLNDLVGEYGIFEDVDDYRGTRSQARALEEGDLKRNAMDNTPARSISLSDYLLDQWHLAEVDARIRALGAKIIERLELSGRLLTPLAELAAEVAPPASPAELNAALAAVQRLDPPGVAARSVTECLLLQLAAQPGNNELEQRIVREHLDDLRKNRLPAIARALGVDVEEVKDAIRTISGLALHPGAEIGSAEPPAIVPDVIVEYNEQADAYEVRLARGNTRELRISPEFRELLEQSRHDKQTREFVKQKIEAAGAIIDAVRYRRERLLEVARAVVEAQRDFLDKGDQYLRVLRMSDLAVRFNCDPSTISRTVDEKYLQTPRGIYPLRQFFTGGAETDDGEVLGWASIKAKVEEIIAREDKHNPLSDDEIVTRLKEAGVDLKRRTVAKYRAQLDIPPARQRREY